MVTARPVITPGVAAFPRRYAATRRFTLGRPRSFKVAPDGTRVAFLRAAAGDDPATGLWVLDVLRGQEELVADPAALDVDPGEVTAEERTRRERARESAEGVVTYAVDEAVRSAVFAVAGQLFLADLAERTTRPVPVPQRVADPRISPDGARIAFVAEGGVWVTDREGVAAARVTPDEDPAVTWGLPEFVAAEEMGRDRGHWWAPDSDALAIARVDTRPVPTWHVVDLADPATPPAPLPYPAAGTPNADVTLTVVPLDGSPARAVEWDRTVFPYLADVVWEPHGPLALVVQTRDQRTLRVLAADPATGATAVLREDHDRHWVDLVPGVPRWLPDGRMVTTVVRDGARRLAVGERIVTAPELEVRGVAGVTSAAVLVTASTDPTEVGVWRVPTDRGDPERLSPPGGVASAASGGETVVLATHDLARVGVRVEVTGPAAASAISSVAEEPELPVRVELGRLGERALPTALVLPNGWDPAEGPLPVLLDPYGGPGHARVVAAREAYLTSQWFAEQGFAVLVIDGRGVPGRGPAWERAVAGDLATAVLEDQVAGLEAAAAAHPGLDLDRVAIRGWSFGGYLAALAVLRRPDVFHAAVAGAPVTDFRLYDTHYTERYLGLPQEQPEAYRRSSLLDDAAGLSRPLMLIHGLADDNVVVAHTLRLSRALLEAGRPHTVLPLSGVTHMTPQEVVAENLLTLQLAFLREALHLATPGSQ